MSFFFFSSYSANAVQGCLTMMNHDISISSLGYDMNTSNESRVTFPMASLCLKVAPVACRYRDVIIESYSLKKNCDLYSV